MKDRTQLTLADCGMLAAVVNMADNKPMITGTLIGICSGIATRKSPDKMSTYRGMMGLFRFVPCDPAGEMIEGPVLIFPEAFNGLLDPMFIKMNASGNGAEIHFVFEISSVKASNEAGFSVNFDPKITPFISDRVRSLMDSIGAFKEVAGKRVLQIEDKTAQAAKKK